MTTDVFSREDRARVMRAVRGRDTRPERRVRSALHRLGYRFRLHDPELPGRPDIVFRARRKVVFVNGCFWHGHGCARGARTPKSNRSYWQAKIERNRARDQAALDRLDRLGWRGLVIWECTLKGEDWLAEAAAFLGPPTPVAENANPNARRRLIR